jgi:hypothetical protein
MNFKLIIINKNTVINFAIYFYRLNAFRNFILLFLIFINIFVILLKILVPKPLFLYITFNDFPAIVNNIILKLIINMVSLLKIMFFTNFKLFFN